MSDLSWKNWGPLLGPGDRRPAAGSWRDRHGEAIRYWAGKELVRVERVRMPDGSRASVNPPQGMRVASRTPNPGKKGFTHGTLNWTDDDVEFTPLVHAPVIAFRTPVVPVLELMRGSAELANFVKAEFHHGVALYTILQNKRLEHVDGEKFRLNQRDLGALIAALRDMGEDYLDFFMLEDDEDFDRGLPALPEVSRVLAGAGFTVSEPSSTD